jgi:hypothetical protein
MPTDETAGQATGLSAPTNGAPAWSYLELPEPAGDGQAVPPIPVVFSVGLTAPDAAGHQWAVLQGDDQTVSARFRIPWHAAASVGLSIAQGLAAMQERAESVANSGLIVPPGANSPLIIAPSGAVPRG